MALLDVQNPAQANRSPSGVAGKVARQRRRYRQKEQPLFELDTDKITSEATAESAGKISLKVSAGAEGQGSPSRIATIDLEVTNQQPEASHRPATLTG